MKELFILEAKYLDKLNRAKKNHIVGVFDNLNKLENAKNTILNTPHEYNSVSFSVKGTSYKSRMMVMKSLASVAI